MGGNTSLFFMYYGIRYDLSRIEGDDVTVDTVADLLTEKKVIAVFKDKGNGFTNIPDIRINTETGRGANLKAVLNFVSPSEVSETLDPTQIISVVDCVDKPLTRNRIT